MGEGTAAVREARELAEGADEGGVSPQSWTCVPQRTRSCPAGPGGLGRVEDGVGLGEGFALTCHGGGGVSLVET